jgi:hypothetical protein
LLLIIDFPKSAITQMCWINLSLTKNNHQNIRQVSWAKSENNRKILPENSGIPCKTCQTPDDTVYDIGFIYDYLCMQYGDSWRDAL